MELDNEQKGRMVEIATKGTRSQMLELATSLGVKGVRDKAKPAIQKALMRELDRMETVEERARAAFESGEGVPAETEPDVDAPVPDPPAEEESGDVYACLTEEQRKKLSEASLERIEGVLSDPDLNDEWRAAFEAERLVRLDQIESQRRVPYEVMNTCAPGEPQGVHYIAPGTSYKAWLPKGTFVFEDTHDFQALRDQGVILEKRAGKVVTTMNQCGIPVSELRPAVPDGEAPRPDAA